MPVAVKGKLSKQRGKVSKLKPVLDVIVGSDRGNGNTKEYAIFPDGTELYFMMPSVVAAGSWKKLQESRQGSNKKDNDDTSKDIVIEFAGTQYFAGNLALLQIEESTTGIGDELRYAADEAVVCNLAAITVLIEEYEQLLLEDMREHGRDPKEVYFSHILLHMVSSVPVRFYKDQNTEAISKKFNNTFECTVNGLDRTFEIDYQTTVMEGGTLEILAAEMPNIDHDEESDNITIDGGEDTVDFVKTGPNDIYYQQCDTIRAGAAHILNLVSNSMNNTYGRELTPREQRRIANGFAEYRRRIKLGQAPDTAIQASYPKIALDAADATYVDKKELHGWMETARKNIARKIISKASALWGAIKGKKIAQNIVRGHAFFVGGETYLLDDLIQEAMPQIIVPDKPEYANAKANAYLSRIMIEDVEEDAKEGE